MRHLFVLSTFTYCYQRIHILLCMNDRQGTRLINIEIMSLQLLRIFKVEMGVCELLGLAKTLFK